MAVSFRSAIRVSFTCAKARSFRCRLVSTFVAKCHTSRCDRSTRGAFRPAGKSLTPGKLSILNDSGIIDNALNEAERTDARDDTPSAAFPGHGPGPDTAPQAARQPLTRLANRRRIAGINKLAARTNRLSLDPFQAESRCGPTSRMDSSPACSYSPACSGPGGDLPGFFRASPISGLFRK